MTPRLDSPPRPAPGSVAPVAAGAVHASGYLRLWLTLVVIFAADQLSKFWVLHHIDADAYTNPPPYPVIDGFFYIVNITNAGAAWGIFTGYSGLLGWLGVVALFAIFYFRNHLELHRPLLQYAFGLLCGGILGNLFDRVFHGGHVVDFLDFHFPGYRYPAFNVADSGITIGVAIYFLYSFRDLRSPYGRKPAA